MATTRHRALARRFAAVVVASLALAVPLLAPSAGVPAATAVAAAPETAYDARVGQGDCELLGRAFVRGRGCARTRCTDGAVLWRKTYGAEACALRGAKQGFGFVATVDSRQCAALQRRWIDEVNYCASEPDRSPRVIYDAPQCVGAATAYVVLAETEGYFDECLSRPRAYELVQRASESETTFTHQVVLRSAVQCGHRPGHVFVNDVCVADPQARPSGGRVLMIGDSLTWRGSDELGRLRPSFVLDGEPARKPTELRGRLEFQRALHGDPEGLIIELGTVPAKEFRKRDLQKVVRSLPRSTEVMFVLPYYELSRSPLVVSPASRRVAGWMRQVGGSRANSCIADWPAYVRSHPGVLQDGVHTTRAAESRWARWIASEWARC